MLGLAGCGPVKRPDLTPLGVSTSEASVDPATRPSLGPEWALLPGPGERSVVAVWPRTWHWAVVGCKPSQLAALTTPAAWTGRPSPSGLGLSGGCQTGRLLLTMWLSREAARRWPVGVAELREVMATAPAITQTARRARRKLAASAYARPRRPRRDHELARLAPPIASIVLSGREPRDSFGDERVVQLCGRRRLSQGQRSRALCPVGANAHVQAHPACARQSPGEGPLQTGAPLIRSERTGASR